jgi:predicted dehydrogenase
VSNRQLFLDSSSGSQYWHSAHLPQPGIAFSLGGEGYAEEDQEFLSSLNGRQRPTVTWQAGLVVQEILDAIYRSAEQGRSILIEGVKESWTPS